MSATFWQRIHGGSTHFPIVLLLASVAFDLVASRTRDEPLRRGLHAAGFGSAVVGLLGGVGAVVAGLMMTHGRMLGGGYERIHHLFVWPAFVMSLIFVGWRSFQRGRIPERGLAVYVVGMAVVSVLMVGAGYSGGEVLLGPASGGEPAASAPEVSALG